ncbi:MAG TPA: lipocalin-like domain-containing protein [Phototrophicaceae bacterium]|jgi:hypothetical protein|nr:lipocalin-like domain-containing protein [Phototrophicaceae bacterium]
MTSSNAIIPFVGTWNLMSQYTYRPDNSATPSRGENPAGILMYDAAGNMAVQLMRTDELAEQFINLADLTTALDGYLAYFGHYEVDEAQGLVLHHVTGASYPGYRGTIQTRQYEFTQDRLILKAVAPDGVSLRVLIWQHIG